MKAKHNGGFTLIELLVVITIIAILASFAVPVFNKVIAGAQQTKQINNAGQISKACLLFATDNNGIFPNGKFDPALGKITDSTPEGTAELCFKDLFVTKAIETEKVFWSPQHTTQCDPGTPDEDTTQLDGGENCWDYAAGLNSSSPAYLPLVFEASDSGGGTAWTADGGGHPWQGKMIVAFVDGSIEKVNLNESGEAKVERAGSTLDLCLVTPGTNGWPSDAAIAPATTK